MCFSGALWRICTHADSCRDYPKYSNFLYAHNGLADKDQSGVTLNGRIRGKKDIERKRKLDEEEEDQEHDPLAEFGTPVKVMSSSGAFWRI